MSAPPYHQQHDDFYDRPSPPPLPHHVETGRDSTDRYPMNDIPVNSPSPYSVYNQQNNSSLTAVPSPAQRYSDQSDMKFMDHYDSDDDLEKIIPRERKKRSCMDKLCCGCCTCCPKWARWCSCIFLIIIIIIVIIIGVLAALFKVPNVQFTGLKQDPVYAYANNVLSMKFEVGISVDNQNLESITFETIKADAYYPAPYNVYIGGGNITDTHIASYAMTNITFPFSVNVNSSDPGQQGVLMDLVTRCGLDGSTPQNLNFDYYIYPTVRIAGIAITPKISKSMSLACPTAELNQLLGGLFSKK